jgi:hypothetical protein
VLGAAVLGAGVGADFVAACFAGVHFLCQRDFGADLLATVFAKGFAAV